MRIDSERAVTIEYIASAAVRHDTLIAYAFRKCLGLPPSAARQQKVKAPDVEYGSMLECFANRESCMDRLL